MLLMLTLLFVILILIVLKRKDQEIKEIIKEKDFEVKLIKDSYSFLYENSPLIYFVLNPRGRIMEFNRQAANLLGISYGDIVGKDISEVFSTSPLGRFEIYVKNIFIKRYDSFQIAYMDKNNTTLTGTAFLNAVVNSQSEIATVQMAALLSGFDNISKSIQRVETDKEEEVKLLIRVLPAILAVMKILLCQQVQKKYSRRICPLIGNVPYCFLRQIQRESYLKHAAV